MTEGSEPHTLVPNTDGFQPRMGREPAAHFHAIEKNKVLTARRVGGRDRFQAPGTRSRPYSSILRPFGFPALFPQTLGQFAVRVARPRLFPRTLPLNVRLLELGDELPMRAL